jgi:hypothetical protein
MVTLVMIHIIVKFKKRKVPLFFMIHTLIVMVKKRKVPLSDMTYTHITHMFKFVTLHKVNPMECPETSRMITEEACGQNVVKFNFVCNAHLQGHGFTKGTPSNSRGSHKFSPS